MERDLETHLVVPIVIDFNTLSTPTSVGDTFTLGSITFERQIISFLQIKVFELIWGLYLEVRGWVASCLAARGVGSIGATSRLLNTLGFHSFISQ